jgi:hypothetical protein
MKLAGDHQASSLPSGIEPDQRRPVAQHDAA